ncbi:hypothetical protein I3842_01G105900 [Carya illinoinensis]|uniref:Peptidase A1 domain-containing protein n=1 Tax=Carya illinoinensis TaxID=32201 RepID=A0A922FYY9_CARIL|nr:hypothetical protein I3842_01G105900 [Carya illinoinensis]
MSIVAETSPAAATATKRTNPQETQKLVVHRTCRWPQSHPQMLSTTTGNVYFCRNITSAADSHLRGQTHKKLKNSPPCENRKLLSQLRNSEGSRPQRNDNQNRGSDTIVDDGFPPVTFYFENSLSLKVYPREYLFPYEGLWCIGWQNSGMQSRDSMNLTLLGDLVLSNKLVLYDLENQAIGWTEYNCSSSIKLQDEQSGTVHLGWQLKVF